MQKAQSEVGLQATTARFARLESLWFHFVDTLEGSTFIVLSRNRETYRERAFFSTAGQRSTTDYGAHVGHEHTNESISPCISPCICPVSTTLP